MRNGGPKDFDTGQPALWIVLKMIFVERWDWFRQPD